RSTNLEIGIDEAGRGPLIGRVYAAAVIWDGESELINDSKKLTKKKRKIAFEWIKSNNKIIYGVGWADSEEIDKLNILQATKLAINRALENLNINLSNYRLLIDGIGWEKQFSNYNVSSIIKGDSTYYSIAAASIIAKEYHDEYIFELCNENSDLHEKYDLLNNMGYGTKKHINGIIKYGYTSFHRKTYKLSKLII
ncbi:MAG: ribonuclease HII, partial [Proteobacteria bacterium]|nr:ribonuclease HII [Pseudomonadota bacterium]